MRKTLRSRTALLSPLYLHQEDAGIGVVATAFGIATKEVQCRSLLGMRRYPFLCEAFSFGDLVGGHKRGDFVALLNRGITASCF